MPLRMFSTTIIFKANQLSHASRRTEKTLVLSEQSDNGTVRTRVTEFGQDGFWSAASGCSPSTDYIFGGPFTGSCLHSTQSSMELIFQDDRYHKARKPSSHFSGVPIPRGDAHLGRQHLRGATFTSTARHKTSKRLYI